MVKIILILIIAFQAVVGNPVSPDCCASKTVGEYVYILKETDASVPEACLKSCSYERASAPGSLYCFATGLLPVQCTAENPVSLNFCYDGICPPEEDLKIVDEYPTTVSNRPSSEDCWNYCRSLCTVLYCPCDVWSYDKTAKICYTYWCNIAETVHEVDWVTGSLCFDTNTDNIPASDDIPGDIILDSSKKSSNTQGNLLGARTRFSDKKFAIGDISKIDIYTGNFGHSKNVIVGIQITYGDGIEGDLHGRKGMLESCVFTPNTGNFVTEVTGTAKNTGPPQFNLIYSLGFDHSGGGTPCPTVGSKDTGTPFRLNPPNRQLAYISGLTTNRSPQMLGQITFHFKKIG